MSYWERKEELKQKARAHTAEMDRLYADAIKHSRENAKIYDNKSFPKDFLKKEELSKDKALVCVSDADSVTAIDSFIKPNEKIAVLNFASYKHPGGMFYNGSSAQEESLCHESFLFNVLREFEKNYYEWNKRNLNRGLYTNRGLYVPDVIFKRTNNIIDTEMKCDVITCAAPNKTTAQKYNNVSDAENKKVLEDRIEFVLNMAVDNNVDTLILGAFGAGVFGQDAKEVAEIFLSMLRKGYGRKFKTIVFAVPKGNKKFSKNYNDFMDVMVRQFKKN